EEMLEIEIGEAIGQGFRLGIDQLQLLPRCLHQFGVGLGTDADPVDTLWRRDRSVGFDGNREAVRRNRRYQRLVQLQQRLAAGEYDVAKIAAALPRRRNSAGKLIGIREAAAAFAVGADEIGVAKLADGRGAVLLAAGPEIAAGKAAKHGRAPGLAAFALQRLEYLLDRIGHVAVSWIMGGVGVRAFQ